MSSRLSHQHVKLQERKTSTCEGPHVPASLFKNKEKEERHRETSTVGLFGRAEHRFKDNAAAFETTKAVCEVEVVEEKDVNSMAGEFIKRRHDRFNMGKLKSNAVFETTEAVCEVEKEEEKDVNSVAWEFIKSKHDKFIMDKLMSMKS